MKNCFLILSVVALGLASCDRTERHHPDQRNYANLRTVVSFARNQIHKEWSVDVFRSSLKGILSSNELDGIAFNFFDLDGRSVPAAFSVLKSGDGIAIVYQKDRVSTEGVISILEFSKILETKIIRKEALQQKPDVEWLK
jgi:hypothetical protein